MEDWWARVVDARLVQVSELLATGLVDAFLRHGSERDVRCEGRREMEVVVKLCEYVKWESSRKSPWPLGQGPAKCTDNRHHRLLFFGALLGVCEIGFASILLSTCHKSALSFYHEQTRTRPYHSFHPPKLLPLPRCYSRPISSLESPPIPAPCHRYLGTRPPAMEDL